MADARLIAADYGRNAKMAGLSLLARALWPALIGCCDDQGRQRGEPQRIKDDVIPAWGEVDAAAVECALQEYENAGLIYRYRFRDTEETGVGLQVLGWHRHHGRLRYRQPSAIPPPPGWRDRVTALDRDDAKPVSSPDATIRIYCPNCHEVVSARRDGAPNPKWRAFGHERAPGYVCPNCDVELLGWRSPRPKLSVRWRPPEPPTARERIVDALGHCEWSTRDELATTLKLPPKTVSNNLTALIVGKVVVMEREPHRPQAPARYRLA
jgi:hypothetical protein